ncbi:glycoside hydrolase family 43 C-terminal domain-containing protein [uncultured Cytophaga sp.]|uniref:lipocalin-like domain-containing protein n=1 Tax=uncultured Cytophaga sp. TaxID=160238 RepID=UPI0026075189|nr:glycoside hydrolase family 43 C-terminal domain-containing protein [uncultured Cytophaga sp.]
MTKKVIYILLGICLYITQSVEGATVPVHDPSITIAYKDASGNTYPTNDAGATRTKYYYVFGTQLGAAYSTDMINWTAFTPTFSINGVATTNYYNLIKSEADYAGLTTSKDVLGNLWAPDIIYNKALGKWTLYFSLSGNAFKSSIIMFTSSKIEGNYERVGVVAYGGFTNSTTSVGRADYAKVTGTSNVDTRYLDNAGAWDNTYAVSSIDPAVSYDQSGKLWMSYGSWSGGIFLLKLSEQTGLRDYSYDYGFGTAPVWNGARLRYDPYMGIHIAGGYYVSGEGSYIRYIKDANGTGYYYMFISMGFYSPDGGYTMRVFRASTIGGEYTDVTGDNAVFSKYVLNYGNNTQYGMPIMQNYKYNWWSMADVAQGHNSVLTDEDGSAYLVYHTKFDNGTAWHNVEVHQLFFNKNGWPLAAPFEYRKNFGLSKLEHSKVEIAGRYNIITHNTVDYANLKSNVEAEMYVNADGTLTGAYTGTWAYSFSAGKQYLTLTTNAGTFEAAVCEQLMDGISTKTIAFTGMNSANEKCLWGYKRTNTATINTTNYGNQALLIGNQQYSLSYGDYANFNKQTVSGDFEIEYTFNNNTLAAENWHNWALAIRTPAETWYLRADAFSVGTFTGTTVDHAYTWDWAQFKEVYKNKKVTLKVSRIGTSINIFAYANDVLVYTCTSKNSPTSQVDVYLGGESCYLDVKKISVATIGAREVVGTTNEDGTYTVPFNSNLGKTTTVSGNFDLRYNFNNYHNPKSVNDWDNYILRVLSGNNTMLIRSDGVALTPLGNLTFSNDYTTNTFLSIISGANIDCQITRIGSTITYKIVIFARDGKTYNYKVVQTNAPTTNLSIGFTGEQSMQDFFIVEKSTTIAPLPIIAKKYIYNYDNSGNYAWSNTNSWTPKAIPTTIDTVIIRTGEVQIGNLNHTAPLYVESNGIIRLIDTSLVDNMHLQGGTLKAYTSAAGMMLTSNITVEQPSTIMAGSIAATVFTLNGTITGNANLTKTSVGNLRINSTASGFKGNWIVTDGKLQLRSASGLGICGVKVEGTARLDIEVAGASVYSLVVANTAGVDLDQNLNVNVAVFGPDNKLTGTYTNANMPAYIASTGSLNVSNSLISLSGSTALCTGNSLTLTSSSGASYIWKNNTTQVGIVATYTTSTTGNYTVNAINAVGCKVTSAPVETTMSVDPTASIIAPATSFCAGESVILTASTGSAYKWFNGTTQVGTSATYTAKTAGEYTVEVTNATGCKATSTTTQISANALPIITPYIQVNADTWNSITTVATCQGSTINLGPQPSSAKGWVWTGPNNFTSVLRNPVLTNILVDNSGNYTTTYTDANGCKATSTFTIQVSALPTATITSPNTAFCAGGSVILTASTANTYKWFKSTSPVGTASTLNVTDAGAYTVEVTNITGCKAVSTPTQINRTTTATPTISAASTSICAGNTLVLTSSTANTYKWFKGTIPVGTMSTLNVTDAGTYTVEVTNTNGCEAVSTPTQISVSNTITWYADTDNDGKGDANAMLLSCTQPQGYVSIAGDACPVDANKTTNGNCGCGNTEASCLDCAGIPNGTAVYDNCNICVEGTTGNTACISTATVNGTNAKISVIPQPFDANTTISIDNLGLIQSFTIISASGALVETRQGLNTEKITLGEELASGLYTVIITTENDIYTTKIVKK